MSAAIAAFVITAGAKIIGGIQQNRIAKKQAEQNEEQARIVRMEAEAEATRKQEERDKFVARQKVAFLTNGVQISGTPATVLEDTFFEFNKEINAIRRQGVAQENFLNTEASINRSEGRAALISGVLGAASSGFQAKAAHTASKKTKTISAKSEKDIF